MCWSKEVSLLSAVFAWGVCIYLYRRNLNFDRWSAAYLLTFSFTQMVDVALWHEEGRVGLATCSDTNYSISKFIIPLVIFSQHLVQCHFPTNILSEYRLPLALAHLLPILGMVYQFQCSSVVDSIHGPSLCWGSHIAESYQILIHAGVVAFVFVLLMPLRVAVIHNMVLASVVYYLFMSEGTLGKY